MALNYSLVLCMFIKTFKYYSMKIIAKIMSKRMMVAMFSVCLMAFTCVSCKQGENIKFSKDIHKRESKNIVSNIQITKFSSDSKKLNKELMSFNASRMRMLISYVDTLKADADDCFASIDTVNFERPSWKYGLYVSDTVVSIIPNKIISVLQTESTFTGGAHPNNITKSYNYDLVGHRFMEVSDIINMKDSMRVNELLRSTFKANNKFNIELFDEPSLEKLDAIGVTSDSVIFIFNQYTLACYAAGVIKIEVQRSDLGDALKI